eukprot:365159-Chlamydomonas_euryale.AAC.16
MQNGHPTQRKLCLTLHVHVDTRTRTSWELPWGCCVQLPWGCCVQQEDAELDFVPDTKCAVNSGPRPRCASDSGRWRSTSNVVFASRADSVAGV